MLLKRQFNEFLSLPTSSCPGQSFLLFPPRADRPTIIIFYRFSLAVGILAFYGSVVRLVLDTYLGSPQLRQTKPTMSVDALETNKDWKKIAKLKCL